MVRVGVDLNERGEGETHRSGADTRCFVWCGFSEVDGYDWAGVLE